MTSPDPETGPAAACAEDLAALLAEERARLLAGDLAVVPALIFRKERLLSHLQTGAPPPAPVLERLKAAAQANQGLLDAALRGVRAARERLESLRAGGAALSTYDARGRAATLTSARPSVERRA